MTTVRILTAALAISLLAACSSTPKEPYTFKARKVTIITEPPGAQVMQYRPFGLKSEDLGVTPIIEREVLILTNVDRSARVNWNEALDHASNLVVLVRKDGYRSRKMKLAIKGFDTNEFTIQLGR
ncbi:MAG: hypothetical protein ABFS86_16800 [Planctomycetota bacterium]